MLARAYRARWPVAGRVRRTTYVIGPDRKVRDAYRSELRPRSHVERACEVLAAGGEAS
jgi:peroxiredoxin